MKRQTANLHTRLVAAGLIAAAAMAVAPASAQPPGGFGGFGGGPAASPRDSAPVDLTGYWVSLVTEDWIERMAPDSPPSGTGGGFGFGGGGGGQGGPGGPGGPQVSNPDDPCRVYAAGGSLRVPGRLNISWLDDSTMQVEMDAGSQTRVFHFDSTAPAPSGKSLQGHSVASWQTASRGRGGFGGGFGAPAAPAQPEWGKLTVVTTNLSGGYLLTSRSNYSADAVLTEHFTHHSSFGEEFFTVTAIIEDGGTTTVASSTFRKEPDGSKFNPTGCEIRR